MMTPSAFNALLKTLEEPPAYCIFIMATTEPHKVLPTIVSRCQRFDFNKVPTQLIKERLKHIADQENIKCEDGALQLIAEIAEGGMRDALSIMDQCIAYAQNDIKASDVSAVYGIATTREKMELFECVSQKNTKELMEKARNLSNRGIDLQRLTTDLINIAKETVVYSYSHDSNLLTVINEEQANEIAGMFSVKQLLESIDYLMDVSVKYKDATDSLSYFEVCLLKMVNLSEDNKPIKTVEFKQTPKNEPKQETVTVIKRPEPEKPKELSIKHLSNEELYRILTRSKKDIREKDSARWPEVCRETKGLDNTRIMASSEKDIIVVVPSREQTDVINEETKQKELEEITERKLGSRKTVTAITTDQKILLISYFRERTGPIPIIKEEPKEAISETEQRLINLFGKNGYKKVEE